MAESVQVLVKENIDLTDLEKRIFERLVQTLNHFHLDTQLRVAGGWVRDKLLGKECYDIDIAVDNMLGSEFVDKLTELCISYLDCARNLMQLLGCSTFSDEQRRLSLYAALFLPFRKTIHKDNKAKKVPVVNYIFRESLKRKASDAETVINVHRALERFLSLIPFLTSEKEIQLLELDSGIDIDDVTDESKLRIVAGFLLRDIKDFWRVALLMSTLVYPVDVDCTQDFLEGQFQLDKKMDLFKAAEDAIIKLGLDKVWDVKPLVNGKEIMGVLQLSSGKPIVREWQQKLLAWQLAHPSQTAEQCLDWMRQSLSHPKRIKLTE